MEDEGREVAGQWSRPFLSAVLAIPPTHRRAFCPLRAETYVQKGSILPLPPD